jgi:hypothetical protein
MSRKFMLASLALAVAVAMPGLAPADTGTTEGLKIGMNFATFSGADAKVPAPATASTRDAIVFGGYVGFGLGPVTLQPELLYSLKGREVKATVLGVSFTNTTQLNYIDIPVLVRYSITPAPTKLVVFAGPSLGILMSAMSKTSVSILSGSVDIKDQVNSTDIGLVIGAGVSLIGLNLDARYQMGLSPVEKAVGGVTPKVHNSVITVMLGFPL